MIPRRRCALHDAAAPRRFAAYVHDVEHVVLDNLQFMTQAGPRDASRFEDRVAARPDRAVVLAAAGALAPPARWCRFIRWRQR